MTKVQMHPVIEGVVSDVCGSTWYDDDKDGGYGVAIVLAYIRGCKPSLTEIASHIDVDSSQLAKPFERLMNRGVFTSKFDVRNDPKILNQYGATVQEREDWARKAMAQIAGIASGMI